MRRRNVNAPAAVCSGCYLLFLLLAPFHTFCFGITEELQGSGLTQKAARVLEKISIRMYLNDIFSVGAGEGFLLLLFALALLMASLCFSRKWKLIIGGTAAVGTVLLAFFGMVMMSGIPLQMGDLADEAGISSQLMKGINYYGSFVKGDAGSLVQNAEKYLDGTSCILPLSLFWDIFSSQSFQASGAEIHLSTLGAGGIGCAGMSMGFFLAVYFQEQLRRIRWIDRSEKGLYRGLRKLCAVLNGDKPHRGPQNAGKNDGN